MKKWNILSGLTAAVMTGWIMTMPVLAEETVIPEGIYVGTFSLGGMTGREAEETIQAYIKSQQERAVTIAAQDQTAETTAGELGFVWNNPEVVKQAEDYKVTGNLIQQYMGLKDLEKDPVRLPLEAAVDEAGIETFVKANFEGLTGGPTNASIIRENGAFVITPGTAGNAVDMAATKAAIDEALAASEDGAVTVEASITVEEPEIREEDLASIQDVLGTFSTSFSSSGASRSGNLTNGTAKINGRVLMPGETLSGYECMSPFTTENGYFTAAAYENGQVVDSIGGGVCQIATTLYNAALRAELEITQRQNHSMVVGYVKPSMDAAIAGTYKDIKITNNYSTPIYVEGTTGGKNLTFTIYGKETRPENRVVEYISETLSETDPGAPIEQPDASLAPGIRKQVQSAHRGLKSQLWKVVKVDGVETERTLLSKDTYKASKAVVLVGPPAEPTAPAVTDPTQQPAGEPTAESTAPEIVEGVNGGPGVTGGSENAEAPVQTPPAAPVESPMPAPVEVPPAPVG